MQKETRFKQPFNLEVKNSRWNTRDSCGNKSFRWDE